MYDFLSQDIMYLAGVGPRRAKVLNKDAEVFSLRDLLNYYPYKYVDRSKVYKICEVEPSMASIQLQGTIKSFVEDGVGRKRRLEAIFDDGTGIVRLVWFGGIQYVRDKLKTNTLYLVFGKLQEFNHAYTIVQPEVTHITPQTQMACIARLHPAYTITEGMRRAGITSSVLEKMIENVFEKFAPAQIPDTLPQTIINRHQLLSLGEAIYNVHIPQSDELLERARYRLKFEELFFIQLDVLNYAHLRTRKYRGFRFPKIGQYFLDFYHNHLPFELTNAQKRVLREIRQDVGSGLQMNRLLQGDVGSGKTIVAVQSMLMALDNGYQACIMAPTEILAEQHYRNISRMLQGMDVRVELLTSSVVGRRRKDVLEGVNNGSVHILIGTHALLGDMVIFQNLGLAVIDEQHRFGVEQRAKLWAKNTNPPHVLVMTATPIPRTLAMTIYGDLSVSVIDELPPGRKPIQTLHIYEENEERLVQMIRAEIEKGRQVYFVYPLIEESEKSDLKDLETGYKHISALFSDLQVERLHGKMKDTEKNEIMARFKIGETHILVSTTVIEVGVDVPNASVMVIMNANRFGLAQLHQLRGRVGRGAEQSWCILVTGYKLSEIARKRLEIMQESTDGFYIAEEDLKLRGPGMLDGTQQSGILFDLKMANITRDSQLMEICRKEAEATLAVDPEHTQPKYQIVWQQLAIRKKTVVNLSNIS